jgi:biotin carboxyl carrier protein
MDTRTLAEFIAWSKTTDLQELIYQKPGASVKIKTAAVLPQSPDFSTKLTPALSPAVGIYHSGVKGKEIVLKENMEVKKGALLGVIQMNKTSKELLAPADGLLKIIGVSDGQCAEYGQPLFFIEPKQP